MFPVASTVGLEDEVVACCCSQGIEAFFCPWLGSLSQYIGVVNSPYHYWPPLIEIDYCG